MAFTPTILRPECEPWFIRELHLIDPNLRVVWGFDRYLLNCFVIERWIPPERYALVYRDFLSKDQPRYVDQPIIDQDQPIYNERGEIINYRIVGYRHFDMTPEWEYIQAIWTRDGDFKQPGQDDLIALRRQYAWNFRHPCSRARYEAEEERKAQEKERDRQRQSHDMILEACDQAWRETGAIIQGSAPQTMMEGTEL